MENLLKVTNILEIISIILVTVGLIIIIAPKKIKIINKLKNILNPKETKISNKIANKIFIGIFVLSVIILFYKLGKIPYGLHVDEAGMAYDAWCLSEHGVDRYLNRLPVYLINFGGGQSALYAYLTAIIVRITGMLNTFVIRLPAVLLSLISLVLMYKMLQENKGNKEALIISVLVTLCPWFIMKARWGLDCNLLSSMSIISIYFLIKAINTHKYRYFIIAGISFGITLYTYAISYIILPIFLIAFLLPMLLKHKVNIKEMIVFSIPLAILAIPLILLLLYNNGIIGEVKLPFITIPKLFNYRGTEISTLNIGENVSNIFNILFISDFLVYNGFGEVGTLYKMSIILVIIGFIISVANLFKRKQENKLLEGAFIALFLSTFVCMLLIKSPNINKANCIYMPMIYFEMIGIIFLSKYIKYFDILILCMMFINFIFFISYYYFDYVKVKQPFFENDIIEITEYIEDKNNGKTIYFYDRDLRQPYIYTLFVNKTSPYKFNKSAKNKGFSGYKNYRFYFPETIDKKAIYILDIDDNKNIEDIDSKGFYKKIINKYCILYK